MLDAVTFTPHCPTCHEAVTWEGNPWRPFCSERCRMIDLGAWITERYRVPGEPADDTSEGEEPGKGGSGTTDGG